MRNRNRFSLPCEWWVQTGERMLLGMSVRSLLEGATVTGKHEKQGLLRILQGIEEGQPVTGSMRRAGLQLPAEIWCLLETGELTGRLGEMFLETGQVLRQRGETMRDIIAQLWYPAMVFTVGAGVMSLILLWVIPQMRAVSESMGLGEKMPWLTEHIGLLYGSLFAGSLGGLFMLSAAVALLRKLSRKSIYWGRLAERLARSLPGAGPLLFCAREAGILRQLGILLKGGVTFPAALEMISGSVSSKWVQEELMNWRSRLLLGTDFRDAVAACMLVGAGELPLIMAGQESGQLDTYLGRIADDLYRQVSRSLKAWSRLLEPTMLLCLSMAVGGLVLAYLLPMVRLLEQAGGAF